MLYKVENIKVKYLNFSSADATKPAEQNKINSYYKTNIKGCKNYSKTKKTRSLPSPQDDQLQTDYRLGRSRDIEWLQSGSWRSNCYRRLISI
jgi:hypothetical protein